jgi:hypothetical protein
MHALTSGMVTSSTDLRREPRVRSFSTPGP